MYDFDYEYDALLALRLLKFLHMQDPDALKDLYDVCKDLASDAFSSLLEMASFAVWDIFSDAQFEENEEWDTSTVTFSHPVVDRFYDLSKRWSAGQGISRVAILKKTEDTVHYFAETSYSVDELDLRFSGGHVRMVMRLSSDCYTPLVFGNTLIDMLLYCQRENQRIEALLRQTGNDDEDEEKEAA